jgi:hypothetical protein
MTNNPTICIPKVEDHITKIDILSVFNKLNIGEIFSIRFVGKKSKTVIIKLRYWNKRSQDLRNRLVDGKPVNIVYNFPWYWKCVMMRG